MDCKTEIKVAVRLYLQKISIDREKVLQNKNLEFLDFHDGKIIACRELQDLINTIINKHEGENNNEMDAQ